MFLLAFVLASMNLAFGVDGCSNRAACTLAVQELKLRTTIAGSSPTAERVDGYYVRHSSLNVRIDQDDGTDLFDQDSTWAWRDGCGGPLNGKMGCDVSFEATTTGYSNWWLRHQFFDVKIQEYVDDAWFQEDASFTLVPALNGDSACHSFEATIDDGAGGRQPGWYLRHSDLNVIISQYDADDEMFLHDATFCIEFQQ
mmetsp:Transcript_2299/g.3741  ORF Transcript_2299/g.3741 Transcript_2299/m.3741 type:complete len:198 (+) Transcript_2299:161-754(+)|eukprot:CAMPEP_0197056246 /NCGR_PEP_ID=MMETSP1384-20130603/81268_1 /TAXON_ID=29189 /ORGANISM="Ammonia sp." /LENGTH=197 /DNA_ID=CAMNT_0042490151 /DNA_START=141 /DNA_END=734 /DNA_ORIENTATION=+